MQFLNSDPIYHPKSPPYSIASRANQWSSTITSTGRPVLSTVVNSSRYLFVHDLHSVQVFLKETDKMSSPANVLLRDARTHTVCP